MCVCAFSDVHAATKHRSPPVESGFLDQLRCVTMGEVKCERSSVAIGWPIPSSRLPFGSSPSESTPK